MKEEEIILNTKQGQLILRTALDWKLKQMVEDDNMSFMHSDVSALLSLLNKDSVCVDVGANIGAFTCAIAGKVGHVVSVEPVKPTANILRRNIELNKLTNVKVLECGLGDSESEMSVDHAEVSSSAFLVEKNGHGDNVKVHRLDQVVEGKVDFIKIDVQGMDTLVVKGASEIIKKYSPIFFIEYWAANKQIGRKELKEYLSMLGDYNFYINIKKSFSTGREEFLLAKLPSLYVLLLSSGTQDFYAVRKDKEVNAVSGFWVAVFLILKVLKTKAEVKILKNYLSIIRKR